MTTMVAWWAVAAAFLVSWTVIFLRLRFAGLGVALPNHRSLHEKPTPHGGGLGIVGALLATGIFLGVPAELLTATLALALLSLADDLRPLPFGIRLTAHLAAALAFCFLLKLEMWLWLPTMLSVTWMTNLYNFMDGADGLAGTQGVVGFAAYAIGFAMAGDAVLASWCAAAAVACIAFLCFNWPPARIFMGDVGSIPLGFLAGALGALGMWRGVWPMWFPVLVFAPFVLDASITLGRRAHAGQRVWEAHRDHTYQRMVALGYGHRGMTVRWGAAMSMGALLAAGLLAVPAWLQWSAVGVWLSMLLRFGLVIDRRFATRVKTEQTQ